MRRSVTVRNLLLAVLLAALVSGAGRPAAAQSLFAARGLGLPVMPLGARAQGLGGVGLGLPGDYLVWANPASTAGLPAPSLLASYQFDDYSAELGDREFEGSTARFPLLLAGSPIGERWSLSLGYGSLLDQNWAVEQADTQTIAGNPVPFIDRISSEGGVGVLRLGGAYAAGERFSAGLAVNVYTGAVDRVLGRDFEGDFQDVRLPSQLDYGGVGYTAGVRWSPSEAFNLAAAATAGGTLDAEPQDELGTEQSYDLPVSLDVGGSARIASNTLLALSAGWAGWSSADAALTGVGGARDTWKVHGGVEWDAIVAGDRTFPLRLGARYAALPFRWGAPGSADDWAAERALTAGLGAVLAGGAARGDIAVERGERGGEEAGITESYWRTVFSITVLGR
jgi:hypothetical protein